MVQPNMSGRINEILDSVKNEFDSILQEASMYKLQRDDLELKGM